MNQSLLMCNPAYFGVNYVINPWMQGQVGKVDSTRARTQWREFYEALGRLADVKLIDPLPHVPDLVFTANAGILRGNKFIPSRFRHDERRAEEPCFKAWFSANGYEIVELPEGIRFEGAGDALPQPGRDRIWAGYGFRTDLEAHGFLTRVFQTEVISLQLVNPRFYHLDTCFCPLLDDHVMYYPGAFDPGSVRTVEEIVPPENRVAVSREDAENFACNAVLAEKTLFMNGASRELRSRLERAGYVVAARPVTEFLKAGGANKCLTMALNELSPQTALNFKNVA